MCSLIKDIFWHPTSFQNTLPFSHSFIALFLWKDSILHHCHSWCMNENSLFSFLVYLRSWPIPPDIIQINYLITDQTLQHVSAPSSKPQNTAAITKPKQHPTTNINRLQIKTQETCHTKKKKEQKNSRYSVTSPAKVSRNGSFGSLGLSVKIKSLDHTLSNGLYQTKVWKCLLIQTWNTNR